MMDDGDIQATCFALMDHIRGIRVLEPEALKCGIDQVCQELLARVDAGPGRRSERMASVINANANLVKWGVHVLGADDWYPAADYETAVRMADQGNALCAQLPNDGEPILWFAYAGLWPGTEAEHAAALERQETERREQRGRK